MVNRKEIELCVAEDVPPDLFWCVAGDVEIVGQTSNDRFEGDPHRRKMDSLVLATNLHVGGGIASFRGSQIVVSKNPVLTVKVLLVLKGGLPSLESRPLFRRLDV